MNACPRSFFQQQLAFFQNLLADCRYFLQEDPQDDLPKLSEEAKARIKRLLKEKMNNPKKDDEQNEQDTGPEE